MSNSTNKKQLEVLVGLMEKFPDIATGYTKKTKEEVHDIWKTVENELNCIGPPKKSSFEWKRVWSDKKKYVKKKMSENIKFKSATGGGPSKEYKFSNLEQSIIQICAISESVEGHSDSKRFGLPSCSKKRKLESPCDGELNVNNTHNLQKDQEDNSAKELDAIFESLIEEDDTACNVFNEALDDNCIGEKTPKRSNKSCPKVKNSVEFVQKELSLQEKMYEQVREAVLIMKNHQNEIQASVKKIYRSIDRIHDQQKLLLKETKRHNLEMEKIRKHEIEQKLHLKQKVLDIELAKLEKY